MTAADPTLRREEVDRVCASGYCATHLAAAPAHVSRRQDTAVCVQGQLEFEHEAVSTFGVHAAISSFVTHSP